MLEVNNADQELANVVTPLQEATQSHLLRTTKTSKTTTKMTAKTKMSKMTAKTKNKAEMRKSAMERGKRGRESGKTGEFRKCPVILLDDLDVNLYSAAASFAASDAANRMGPNPQLNPNGTIGTIGSTGSTGSNGTSGSIGSIGSFGPIRSIGSLGSLGSFGPIGPPTSPASSSSLSSSFGGSIASLTALDCFAVYAEKVRLALESHAQSSSLRPGFLKSVKQLIQHSKCPILLTASALSVQVFMMIKQRAKSPPSRPISCSSLSHRSPR